MAIFSLYEGLDDISARLSIPSLVFAIVTPLVVLARFIARCTHGNSLGADDWTILASLCFAQTVNIQMIICCEWGFGKHTKELPTLLVARTLELYFFAQILYKITIGLTKTSILLLYLRVFGIWRPFRFLCWLMIGVVVSFALASVMASIFQCSPVRYAFDKTANGGHGTCINLTTFWYANAGFNIGSDAIIIVMPVLPIKSLNIPFRSKIALCGVFAVGIFVCITSILRFTTLDLATSHTDVMWQSIASSMWTVIEYNLGIIAASMPALRRPLARLLPRLLLDHSTENSARRLHDGGSLTGWPQGSSTISSASTKTSRFSFPRAHRPDDGDTRLGRREMTMIPDEKDERYRSGLRTELFDLEGPDRHDLEELERIQRETSDDGGIARGDTEDFVLGRDDGFPSSHDWRDYGILKTTEYDVRPSSKRTSNSHRSHVFPN